MDDFAVFILTHGRADNVITYYTLEKLNYTGKVYIIIDNEDSEISKYKENFGDKVIVFDKKATAEQFDEMDNFNKRNSIFYARNESFNIAKKLGIKYFLQLDDDYTSFLYRITENRTFNNSGSLITNLDKLFASILTFYKSINCKTIAIAQGGDFIGGENGSFAKDNKLRRKAMNTFFCSTDRPFEFIGKINEDVNTYTLKGSQGDLFLTIPIVMITQKQTQSNEGGMTDIYKDSGTYIKSFYSVIAMPSSVTISLMGNQNMRLHHKVSWNKTVPEILSETLKK